MKKKRITTVFLFDFFFFFFKNSISASIPGEVSRKRWTSTKVSHSSYVGIIYTTNPYIVTFSVVVSPYIHVRNTGAQYVYGFRERMILHARGLVIRNLISGTGVITGCCVPNESANVTIWRNEVIRLENCRTPKITIPTHTERACVLFRGQQQKFARIWKIARSRGKLESVAFRSSGVEKLVLLSRESEARKSFFAICRRVTSSRYIAIGAGENAFVSE